MFFYDVMPKPFPALDMSGDAFKVCCSDYETIAVFSDYDTAAEFIALVQEFCDSRGLVNINDICVRLVKEVENND